MVRPERFELPTYSSGGCRSIQTELRAHCGLSSVQRGSGALNGLRFSLDSGLHSGPDTIRTGMRTIVMVETPLYVPTCSASLDFPEMFVLVVKP